MIQLYTKVCYHCNKIIKIKKIDSVIAEVIGGRQYILNEWAITEHAKSQKTIVCVNKRNDHPYSPLCLQYHLVRTFKEISV